MVRHRRSDLNGDRYDPTHPIIHAPKAKPISIRCKDCGKRASALLHPDREELPTGGVGAWVWFRRVYMCPDCSKRIINEILRR